MERPAALSREDHAVEVAPPMSARVRGYGARVRCVHRAHESRADRLTHEVLAAGQLLWAMSISRSAWHEPDWSGDGGLTVGQMLVPAAGDSRATALRRISAGHRADRQLRHALNTRRQLVGAITCRRNHVAVVHATVATSHSKRRGRGLNAMYGIYRTVAITTQPATAMPMKMEDEPGAGAQCRRALEPERALASASYGTRSQPGLQLAAPNSRTSLPALHNPERSRLLDASVNWASRFRRASCSAATRRRRPWRCCSVGCSNGRVRQCSSASSDINNPTSVTETSTTKHLHCAERSNRYSDAGCQLRRCVRLRLPVRQSAPLIPQLAWRFVREPSRSCQKRSGASPEYALAATRRALRRLGDSRWRATSLLVQ